MTIALMIAFGIMTLCCLAFGLAFFFAGEKADHRQKIIDRHIEEFCKLLFAADDAKLDKGDEKQREVYRHIRSLCDGTYRIEKP